MITVHCTHTDNKPKCAVCVFADDNDRWVARLWQDNVGHDDGEAVPVQAL